MGQSRLVVGLSRDAARAIPLLDSRVPEIVPEAGTPPGLVDTDVHGDARPNGGYDIGPDET